MKCIFTKSYKIQRTFFIKSSKICFFQINNETIDQIFSERKEQLKESFEKNPPKELKDENVFELVCIYIENNRSDQIQKILKTYTLKNPEILNKILKLLLQEEIPFSEIEFEGENEETRALKVISICKNMEYQPTFLPILKKFINLSIPFLIDTNTKLCIDLYETREGKLEEDTYSILISTLLNQKVLDLAFDIYKEMTLFYSPVKELSRRIIDDLFSKGKYTNLIELFKNKSELVGRLDYSIYFISLINLKISKGQLLKEIEKNKKIFDEYVIYSIIINSNSRDYLSILLTTLEKLNLSLDKVIFWIIQNQYKILEDQSLFLKEEHLLKLIEKASLYKDYIFLFNFNQEILKNEKYVNQIITSILINEAHYDHYIQQIYHILSKKGIFLNQEIMDYLFDFYYKENKVYLIYYKLLSMHYELNDTRNQQLVTSSKPFIANLQVEDQYTYLIEQLKNKVNILKNYIDFLDLSNDINQILNIFYKIPKEKSNYYLSIIYQKVINLCLLKHKSNDAFSIYLEMITYGYYPNLLMITKMTHEYIILNEYEKILSLYHDLIKLKMTPTPELEEIIHFSEKEIMNDLFSHFK